MISKIYYSIWSDCIKKIQTVPSSKKRWRFYTLTVMSLLMALNFMFVMMVIQNSTLGVHYFYKLNIDIFPDTKLDAFLSFFILFMLPMLVINYILIIRNDRYKKIIDMYPTQNGKLFLKYLLASLWIPFLLLIISLLYFNITK